MSPAQAQARQRRTVTITGRPDRVPVPGSVDRRAGGIPATRSVDRAPRGVVYAFPARGPRAMDVQRRRPARSVPERLGPRPDRLAMWAVFMALFLIAVTIASPGG